VRWEKGMGVVYGSGVGRWHSGGRAVQVARRRMKWEGEGWEWG